MYSLRDVTNTLTLCREKEKPLRRGANLQGSSVLNRAGKGCLYLIGGQVLLGQLTRLVIAHRDNALAVAAQVPTACLGECGHWATLAREKVPSRACSTVESRLPPGEV